ncbi:MAG: exodeoxyribonuclease VII small subunit [Erysipelotrichaceae bacterium]
MTEKQSFEVSMNRLNTIIGALERNDITLDESLVLFEEGLGLIKECDGQLKNFEGKVRELMEHYSPKGE